MFVCLVWTILIGFCETYGLTEEGVRSLDDIAQIPTGRFLRLEKNDGHLHFGDGERIFPFCTKTGELTFDVSNLCVLTWQPLPALGDFEWRGLKIGGERFDLRLATREGFLSATVINPNDKANNVRLRLSAQDGTKISIAGPPVGTRSSPYFDEPGIVAEFSVPAHKTVEIREETRS